MHPIAVQKPRTRASGRKKTSCSATKTANSGLARVFYGVQYLDPKTSRWISADPAMGEYVPQAPINDEAKKNNKNLPGMGGIYNTVNMHVFHYAGNNPVKLVDPDGRLTDNAETARAIDNLSISEPKEIDYGDKLRILDEGEWNQIRPKEAEAIESDLRDFGSTENTEWRVDSTKTRIKLKTGEDTLAAFRNAKDSWARSQNKKAQNVRPEDVDIYTEFTIRVYQVRKIFSDGTMSPVLMEYVDINDDGHIDGEKSRR